MSEAATALLASAAVLIAIGAPLGVAATRRAVLGVAIAPVIAAALAAAAATAAIATRSSWVAWLVVAVVAGWCAAAKASRRRTPLLHLDVPAAALTLAAMLALPSLVGAAAGPVGWDARTTWWFHAEWLAEGGDAYSRAMDDEATSWAHADYPPLAPAVVATTREATARGPFAPDPDRVALATSALVSFSALVVVAAALIAAVPARSRLLTALVTGAGLLAWSGLVTGSTGLASGYNDYLWSALFGAAAVLWLVHPPDRDALRAGAVLLAAATVTKNEGLAAAVALVPLALVRHRRAGTSAWAERLPFVVAAVPGLAWAVLARWRGAESELVEGGHLGGILRGDADAWGRLAPTLEALRGLDWPMSPARTLAVAVAVAVVGRLGLADRRVRRGIGSDLWLWMLATEVLGLVVAAYLASPADIGWHLRTSVDRTVLPVALLVTISVIVWVRLALSTLFAVGGRSRPQPDRTR